MRTLMNGRPERARSISFQFTLTSWNDKFPISSLLIFYYVRDKWCRCHYAFCTHWTHVNAIGLDSNALLSLRSAFKYDNCSNRISLRASRGQIPWKSNRFVRNVRNCAIEFESLIHDLCNAASRSQFSRTINCCRVRRNCLNIIFRQDFLSDFSHFGSWKCMRWFRNVDFRLVSGINTEFFSCSCSVHFFSSVCVFCFVFFFSLFVRYCLPCLNGTQEPD